MRALALGLSLLAVAGSTRASETIDALLSAVTKAQRFPVAARADVSLERTDGERPIKADLVLVGRGHTVYVESRDGLRALVRPSKRLVLDQGRVIPAPVDLALAASDLRLEDLTPITQSSFRVPQVSDDGPTGTVLTGAPTGRTGRALLVLTIDPTTHTVGRIKIYERSVSELAAFRRDEEFVDVDGRGRPASIVLERVRERSTTTATLTWRSAIDLPRTLWTPAGLRAPSPIRW